MSSGHTNYCSLNQWQASDKVLRTEFNEDNQKTDTALSSLDSRLKTLENRLTLNSYVGTG